MVRVIFWFLLLVSVYALANGTTSQSNSTDGKIVLNHKLVLRKNRAEKPYEIKPLSEDAAAHLRGDIPPMYWYCGSGNLMEKLAQWVSTSVCKDNYAVNHCCAIHDDCYNHGKLYMFMKKVRCDISFCWCLFNAMSGVGCVPASFLACDLVQVHGILAYTMSAVEFKGTQALPSNFGHKFIDFYSRCTEVQYTTSSCVLFYNRDGHSKKSIENLKACMSSLRGSLEESKPCLKQLNDLLDSMEDFEVLDYKV